MVNNNRIQSMKITLNLQNDSVISHSKKTIVNK